jgi:plastocyanin
MVIMGLGSKPLNTEEKQTRWRMIIAGAVSAACLAAGSVKAASLAVHVTADGHSLPNAVVTAVPREPASAVPTRTRPRVVMVQQFQQFAPFVLPVQVGTVVEFPNRDPFRHHVYSFSPAKPFELKLYGGNQTETVTFDKPGVVALGCNIHDNMLAYIDVVPTPYFVKTGEDGNGEIPDMPAGSYTIVLWHPDQTTTQSTEQSVVLSGKATTALTLTAQVKARHRQTRSGPIDETTY